MIVQWAFFYSQLYQVVLDYYYLSVLGLGVDDMEVDVAVDSDDDVDNTPPILVPFVCLTTVVIVE
jgi:hypothetical protein